MSQRVSELTQLNRDDVHLGVGAHVRCLGKGRKERCTPLDEQAVTVLQDWLATTSGHDSDPLWTTPGILEAVKPGRMQGHGGTAEVSGGAA
jgi:site-specific recombinase XerC